MFGLIINYSFYLIPNHTRDRLLVDCLISYIVIGICIYIYNNYLFKGLVFAVASSCLLFLSSSRRKFFLSLSFLKVLKIFLLLLVFN